MVRLLKRNVAFLKLESNFSTLQEAGLEAQMNTLADDMSFLLETLAPSAFKNLTVFSEAAGSCRIGSRSGSNPFSGVTGVVDFCAHGHRDRHNINGGCTMVLVNMFQFRSQSYKMNFVFKKSELEQNSTLMF